MATANRLKWAVIAKLRERIAQENLGETTEQEAVLREALLIRKQYETALDPRLEDEIQTAVEARAYEILGPVIRVERDDENEYLVHSPAREKLARTYRRIATGGGIPLLLHYGDYRSELKLNRRTIADDQRGMDHLRAWCTKNDVKDDVAAITTKVAKQFTRDLPVQAGGIHPRTVMKYVTRLSQYWTYMVYHEHYDENPWKSVVIKVEETPHDEEERAFSDEEVRRLLCGSPTHEMLDLMMIAALTGARLDAIVDLKVRDTIDGAFTFKPQKREKSSRDVPIHPELIQIVKRRSEGKSLEDDFFPEWPGPKNPDSLRERSFKASNQFTIYRRLCGVDERIEGKRRSLVNFHSFRRWFITKAERAGHSGDLIAAVVGHKRSGMTLGRYSEGPEMKAARRCVASVKLPNLDGGPITGERAITPRRRAGALLRHSS